MTMVTSIKMVKFQNCLSLQTSSKI